MSSREERLRRLEARATPPSEPYEMSPIMSLFLKGVDAQRREMDGLPPDPQNAILTEAEQAADREATRNFLPYLLGERERAHPDRWAELDAWIDELRAEIAKLDREETT